LCLKDPTDNRLTAKGGLVEQKPNAKVYNFIHQKQKKPKKNSLLFGSISTKASVSEPQMSDFWLCSMHVSLNLNKNVPHSRLINFFFASSFEMNP